MINSAPSPMRIQASVSNQPIAAMISMAPK
jgi:hypothetical protein